MSKYVCKAYHPISGSVEEIWEGFSWPCFFAGGFWFMAKEMILEGIFAILLSLGTFGIGWLIIPIFANGLRASYLRKQGYLTEVEWAQNQAQKSEIKIVNNQQVRPTSIADELAKLASLKENGILSEEEFKTQKAKLLV